MTDVRHARLAMTPTEVTAFLESRCHLVLGTLGPTGAPHLVTVSYGYRDGSVCFWGYAKSQKCVNLRRDPRVTVLVEDPGSSYSEIRGVQLTGVAQLTDDPAEVRAIGELVLDSVARQRALHPVTAADGTPRSLEDIAVKRLGVWLTPDRVSSWDHRRLGGRY